MNEQPLSAAVPLTPAVRPRPGFWEAVLWCIGFMLVLFAALIGTATCVLMAYAVAQPDPGKFALDQLAGLGAAFQRTGPDQPPRPPAPAEIGAALGYGMFAAQLASFALTWIVLRKYIGRDWKRQLAVRRPAALHLVLVVLMVPAFLILAEGIQELVIRLTGLPSASPEGMLKGLFSGTPWWVTFAAVALGPGVVEELWCRGFLGRGLTARYRIPWGVGITSLLFAFMHGDPSRVFVYTLMGAFLHFVYFAARSIWVPLVLHLLNNGVAVLLEMNPDCNRWALAFATDRQGLRAVMDLAALAVMVFGSVAMWTSRPELIAVKPKDRIVVEWVPEYPGISAPPAEAPAKLSYRAVSPAAVILAMASACVLIFLFTKVKV